MKTVCEVKGCAKPRHGRRFCDSHYRRSIRGGNPHAPLRTFHGHAKKFATSSEYWAWAAMIQRCHNPRNPKFMDYGGRGIRVCQRWNKFENFLADMGLKSSPNLEIDRLDNNGNYEPDNCRWATRKEQTRNRRGNVLITHGGLTLTAQEWSELTGIQRQTILYRYHAGWEHSRVVA